MKCTNSPINKIKYNNINLYVKRDDLLSKEFSGNKARKFYYFLEQDFKNINKIISFGSPQANSLYSFSQLAKLKGVKLDFYVNHIASYLKDNPQGNYFHSINLGANIIEINEDNIQDFIEEKILPNEKNSIFIEEGGRVKEAEYGIKILADEITLWAEENNIKDTNKLKIILPSGTGTTSLFLQKNLKYEVLTCSCVGDDEYLKSQFNKLDKNISNHPTIMKKRKKYHFGKLYKEFYLKYLLLKKDIEFDLLYDPLGFLCFDDYLQENYNKDCIYLYIHQGGIIGNESMLPRYERKYKDIE